MKDSGIEWIKSIPVKWECKRGKQLFIETNERSIAGTEELLTVSHITGVTPRRQKNVNMFMSESLTGYKICHPGDIAANTMWLWQGAVGVSNYHGVISPSYNTYRQRTNDYDSKYLDYLLRIQPLIDTYAAYSTGITLSRLRLYPESFLSIYFIVPPLTEQQHISSYLDVHCSEIDAMLSKTRSSIEEYKKLKQAVITRAVTKGVRGEREMKDSGVEWIGEIPAEWSICPLKRLAAIQTGSTPSKTSSESFYSSIAGTPWIKPDNLGFSSSIETTAEFLTAEGCSVARTLPSNTVYVGCIGSRIGNCGYSLIPCACNQQINALIFNARMYWKYGWYLTIFQEEQYMLLANGNVIQIINSTTQGNISCIVPSISEQREITAYLDAKCAEIDGLIAKKEQLVKELESYKKSLIYEVVTGKREV